LVWRGWNNAEVYDRFVNDHRIYRSLNQKMVELADLAEARHVLDLACGTGATTMACLRVLDMDADLIGVDASKEMVEVARANTLDPRARFKIGAAASVHELMECEVDRVVCNAAFWQFPAAGPVLASLAKIMSPGARFVFNVPAERVKGERASIHPYQLALARSLESRSGKCFDASSVTLMSRDRVAGRAEENGFLLNRSERYVYTGPQRELMELMTIPAMIGPLASGLSEKQRDEALREARNRSDPEEQVEIPWIYFILTKK